MSVCDTFINIVNQLHTQFQSIVASEDEYYNTVDVADIYKKHIDFDQTDSYPAISISSVESVGSRQTDQVRYDIPLIIDIYGYIMDESQTDTLLTTLGMAADMEKAIYTDEQLGGYVWGLSLNISTATYDAYGIIKITINATTEYTK